eukprot:TRINITY_DN5300_c1_g1_i4.p1 TRINITY_DN5300_c1_g1~~TRINITY_DN5300_c1_g1_i4.p1  ORF type:complete len:375 (-),score=60.32 TRINITY_DN5300_c1_g1_i4:223-1347(-)
MSITMPGATDAPCNEGSTNESFVNLHQVFTTIHILLANNQTRCVSDLAASLAEVDGERLSRQTWSEVLSKTMSKREQEQEAAATGGRQQGTRLRRVPRFLPGSSGRAAGRFNSVEPRRNTPRANFFYRRSQTGSTDLDQQQDKNQFGTWPLDASLGDEAGASEGSKTQRKTFLPGLAVSSRSEDNVTMTVSSRQQAGNGDLSMDFGASSDSSEDDSAATTPKTFCPPMRSVVAGQTVFDSERQPGNRKSFFGKNGSCSWESEKSASEGEDCLLESGRGATIPVHDNEDEGLWSRDTIFGQETSSFATRLRGIVQGVRAAPGTTPEPKPEEVPTASSSCSPSPVRMARSGRRGCAKKDANRFASTMPELDPEDSA